MILRELSLLGLLILMLVLEEQKLFCLEWKYSAILRHIFLRYANQLVAIGELQTCMDRDHQEDIEQRSSVHLCSKHAFFALVVWDMLFQPVEYQE